MQLWDQGKDHGKRRRNSDQGVSRVVERHPMSYWLVGLEEEKELYVRMEVGW